MSVTESIAFILPLKNERFAHKKRIRLRGSAPRRSVIAYLPRAHTRALKAVQILAPELRLAGQVHAQLAHDGEVLFG